MYAWRLQLRHISEAKFIVDEVLAVGDAEFQKKCLGKMGDISKGEGRTILFVSHNMSAVKSLCNTGYLLQNGLLVKSGTIDTLWKNTLEMNRMKRIVFGNQISINRKISDC